MIDVSVRFVSRHVAHTRYPFSFQTAKHALYWRIIPTVSTTTHALAHAVMGIGGQGIDGYTQLELRRADSAVDLLQMGITDFIDRVRQADLQVQGRTSAELVNMVAHLMVNEVREC